MPLRTHEPHPSLARAPLVLLPAAALVDLLAALCPRDVRLDRAGSGLWWGTVAAGLAAGNVTQLLLAAGVATWRSRHEASFASALTAMVATGAALHVTRRRDVVEAGAP
jgi:uncharacterized membrane protein